MKRFLLIGALLSAATLPFFPKSVNADPVCFMRSSNGRMVDLTDICGDGSTSPATSTSTTDLSDGDRRMIITAYADRYCEGRRRGLSNEQANAMGTRGMADYIANARGITGAADRLGQITSDDLREGMSMTSSLCPEFQRQ